MYSKTESGIKGVMNIFNMTTDELSRTMSETESRMINAVLTSSDNLDAFYASSEETLSRANDTFNALINTSSNVDKMIAGGESTLVEANHAFLSVQTSMEELETIIPSMNEAVVQATEFLRISQYTLIGIAITSVLLCCVNCVSLVC